MSQPALLMTRHKRPPWMSQRTPFTTWPLATSPHGAGVHAPCTVRISLWARRYRNLTSMSSRRRCSPVLSGSRRAPTKPRMATMVPTRTTSTMSQALSRTADHGGRWRPRKGASTIATTRLKRVRGSCRRVHSSWRMSRRTQAARRWARRWTILIWTILMWTICMRAPRRRRQRWPRCW